MLPIIGNDHVSTGNRKDPFPLWIFLPVFAIAIVLNAELAAAMKQQRGY